VDVNRRNFISVTAKGALFLSLAPCYSSYAKEPKPTFARLAPRGVRIHPLDGLRYPQSFLDFAAGARFGSVDEAVASVQDSRLAFRVETINQ
jgi:hypothetical protein